MRQRGLDGLLDHVRQLARAGDGLVEHRHVPEHVVVVDLLEEAAPDLRQRHLPGDRQDRRVRLGGVVQPVEEVDRARTHRSGAHPESVPQLRLRPGRICRDFLVADTDPVDPVGRADRVGDAVQRITDHSEHVGHALVDERVDQHFADGSVGHGVGLFWVADVISGTRRCAPCSSRAPTIPVGRRGARPDRAAGAIRSSSVRSGSRSERADGRR